jgi:hypothetical protein
MMFDQYDEAEKKLAAAIREYLWTMTRTSGAPEWEIDPDFALLAVTRVVARHVCYRKIDEGDDADELLANVMSDLVEQLDGLGCEQS